MSRTIWESQRLYQQKLFLGSSSKIVRRIVENQSGGHAAIHMLIQRKHILLFVLVEYFRELARVKDFVCVITYTKFVI
jgi:hypothetical protein